MPSLRRSKSAGTDWRAVTVAPLIFVQGSEEYIHTRVTESIKAQLKKAEPDTEIHHRSAAEYQAGELQVLASPSLFGEKKLLIFDEMNKMSDAFVNDGLEYIKQANIVEHILSLYGLMTRV